MPKGRSTPRSPAARIRKVGGLAPLTSPVEAKPPRSTTGGRPRMPTGSRAATVPVQCMCERGYVRVASTDVLAGRTGSCGSRLCDALCAKHSALVSPDAVHIDQRDAYNGERRLA